MCAIMPAQTQSLPIHRTRCNWRRVRFCLRTRPRRRALDRGCDDVQRFDLLHYRVLHSIQATSLGVLLRSPTQFDCYRIREDGQYVPVISFDSSFELAIDRVKRESMPRPLGRGTNSVKYTTNADSVRASKCIQFVSAALLGLC